ncbi:MAG TPA: DUF192 domain-containing protein [Oculatellaceae cyanobacterium]
MRRAFNQTKNCQLASDVLIADHFFARLKGLMFTKNLPAGRGLVIKPCTQIHMFWMNYALDVVFVDSNGVVVGLVERIAPGKISPMFRKATSCIELPEGTISDTRTTLGDRIEVN